MSIFTTVSVSIVAGVFGLLAALLGRRRQSPERQRVRELKEQLEFLAIVPEDFPHRDELARVLDVHVAMMAVRRSFEPSIEAAGRSAVRMALWFLVGLAAAVYGILLLPSWSPLHGLSETEAWTGLGIVIVVSVFVFASLGIGAVRDTSFLRELMFSRGFGWQRFQELDFESRASASAVDAEASPSGREGDPRPV